MAYRRSGAPATEPGPSGMGRRVEDELMDPLSAAAPPGGPTLADPGPKASLLGHMSPSRKALIAGDPLVLTHVGETVAADGGCRSKALAMARAVDGGHVVRSGPAGSGGVTPRGPFQGPTVVSWWR